MSENALTEATTSALFNPAAWPMDKRYEERIHFEFIGSLYPLGWHYWINFPKQRFTYHAVIGGYYDDRPDETRRRLAKKTAFRRCYAR